MIYKGNVAELNKIRKIDWILTLVPFVFIVTLTVFLFINPESANAVLSKVRFFFGDTLGAFYLIMGLGVLAVSVFLVCSQYGDIVLGTPDEKPKYSFFTWGSMMFTCGLAADILFYSFSEWIMYADNPYIVGLGDGWEGVLPLFHWSFIPWAFYLVLAVVFGFMLHARKVKIQRYSEACRGIIGKQVDGLPGRIIDLFAVFALLAGTATTFSVATPLMAEIIVRLFGISISRTAITIIVLLVTCGVYTYAALHGFRGISFLAKFCIILFFGILLYVLVLGGYAGFIIENGVQSFGRMLQHFIGLATYTDPERINRFPQDWTIYYWAYWMVWCIAAPFFIGKISQGKTIRQTVLGGYIFGVGSTIISFVVLGNYSIALQKSGTVDLVKQYAAEGDAYRVIMSVANSVHGAGILLVMMLVCMMFFYATSFDSIAYTAACYSYRKLGAEERPHALIILFWCILLILLPVSLTFSESSMSNIQSVSIISAFPIGIIMILMIWSFIKDAKKYLEEKGIK